MLEIYYVIGAGEALTVMTTTAATTPNKTKEANP